MEAGLSALPGFPLLLGCLAGWGAGGLRSGPQVCGGQRSLGPVRERETLQHARPASSAWIPRGDFGAPLRW